MPKTTLNAIASGLRGVHKLLLEYEKRIYEKTYGRIENPYHLLQLAMEDAQFAWLRAMSAEMVHLDEVRLNRDGVTETDLRLVGTRLRELLIQDGQQTQFQMRYEEAKAEEPAVLLAHRDLMATLPPQPQVELFLSAGNQLDTKDPLPAAIRPGTLIPGFGDKGYHGLGALEERGLLAKVPMKPMRYSNETVLDIASVPMQWTIDGDSFSTTSWEPVIMRAGTGSVIARTPQADGVSVSLYIRQPELGGDPAWLRPEGHEIESWVRLADADDLGTDIVVYALLASPGSEMKIPAVDNHDTLLFVVAGTIEVDSVQIPDSRLALVRHPHNLMLTTQSDAMVLAILVGTNASVTRAGSVTR